MESSAASDAAGGSSESKWNTSTVLNLQTDIDPEIMALLQFDNILFQEDPLCLEMASMYWHDHEINPSLPSYYHNNSTDTNAGFVYWLEGCGGNSSSSDLPPDPNDVEQNYYLDDPSPRTEGPVPMDFFMAEQKRNNARTVLPVVHDGLLEESCFEAGNGPEPVSPPPPPLRKPTLKRRLPDVPQLERSSGSSSSSSKISTSMKKSKVSTTPEDVSGKSKRRGGQKNVKNASDSEERNDYSTTISKQNSGCLSSEEEEEEDSSSVRDSKDGQDNSGKKKGGSSSRTRAGRGSATDPQSLYARKRRERINERLKVLQNLVPNGTKVDISTMLEEAVQYVNFLQLQIKSLSSKDLWMYAPIAYNGMDIGLDLNVSPPPQ